MGCRKLNIRSQFYFVGAEEKSHSHEGTADYTQKTAYSRFSHTVISNYRYYSPELGRWLSRDPIGEEGGYNLYAMVNNNPVNRWDYLGLFKLNFDNSGGKWTSRERSRVRSLFRKVARKIKKRVREIKKKIKELEKCKCTPQELEDLKKALKTLGKMLDGFKSKTKAMTLQKKDFGDKDIIAKALFDTPLIPIYERTLWITEINSNSEKGFFADNIDAQLEAIFHETSHDYGVKDPHENPDYFNNAHVLETLMQDSQSLNELIKQNKEYRAYKERMRKREQKEWDNKINDIFSFP